MKMMDLLNAMQAMESVVYTEEEKKWKNGGLEVMELFTLKISLPPDVKMLVVPPQI
jgi:hypothetical protein